MKTVKYDLELNNDEDKELIDLLKILILIFSAFPSNILPMLEEDEDNKKFIQFFIIFIRVIIVYLSIEYNWDLIMCASISIIISVFSKVLPK